MPAGAEAVPAGAEAVPAGAEAVPAAGAEAVSAAGAEAVSAGGVIAVGQGVICLPAVAEATPGHAFGRVAGFHRVAAVGTPPVHLIYRIVHHVHPSFL